MTPKRARDFTLYIVIGLAFGLGVMWYASRTPGEDAEPIGKWVGLAGTTLVLFGYAIRARRRFVPRLSFWLVLLALLFVHLSVFIAVLVRVEHWKVIWFVLAYPIENLAIDTALSLTGRGVFGKAERRP